MGLVLTLRPHEKIRIGKAVAYVELSDDIDSIPMNVDGTVFYVTDKKKVEILLDVYVSAGFYNEDFQQYRVVFDAPREIKIFREELLR